MRDYDDQLLKARVRNRERLGKSKFAADTATAQKNRERAKALGHRTYIGTVCKMGHTPAIRSTSNKACVECCKVYDKQWKKENRESEKLRKRDLNRNTYAKMRAAYHGATVLDATAQQIRQLRDWQGGRCAYCGSNERLHLDHKTPVSRGGQHTASNLQWLCSKCNVRKSAMTDEEYRSKHSIPKCTPWDGL